MHNYKIHHNLNNLKRVKRFLLFILILYADKNKLSSTFFLIKSKINITYLRVIIQSEINT